MHVSAGISARSLIPKVGSLRELISIPLGAASSLTDPTNCNREGPEIPADRLPNAGGVAPRTDVGPGQKWKYVNFKMLICFLMFA